MKFRMTYHSFLCRFATEVWNQLGFFGGGIRSNCFLDWFADIVKSLSEEDLCVALMVCWSIWRNRNDVVWKGHSKRPTDIVRISKLKWMEWCKVQEKGLEVSADQRCKRTEDRNVMWRIPDPGWVKVNVDAAVFVELNKSGLGGVCRDNANNILAVYTKSVDHSLDPKVAEIMCIREVLSWLKRLKLNRVVVESDSLSAVKAISGGEVGNSYFYLLAHDCHCLLRELDSVRVNFVLRTANYLAHWLARAAINLTDYEVWGGPLDEHLSVLLNCIISDYSQ